MQRQFLTAIFPFELVNQPIAYSQQNPQQIIYGVKRRNNKYVWTFHHCALRAVIPPFQIPIYRICNIVTNHFGHGNSDATVTQHICHLYKISFDGEQILLPQKLLQFLGCGTNFGRNVLLQPLELRRNQNAILSF